MIGAHINFNLKARLNKASAEQFSEIQRQAQTILPTMNPTPIDELHITFGESSYFSVHDERVKIDPHNEVIARDYQRILSHLKSYSFNPITNLTVTGFRVTDNGFIVADLQGDKTASNIADGYREANSNTKLELTKHYRDPKDFTIHVSLGKIDAPKSAKQKEKLTQNVKLIKPPVSTFSTKKKGVLSVSYNAYGERHILNSAVIPFHAPAPCEAWDPSLENAPAQKPLIFSQGPSVSSSSSSSSACSSSASSSSVSRFTNDELKEAAMALSSNLSFNGKTSPLVRCDNGEYIIGIRVSPNLTRAANDTLAALSQTLFDEVAIQRDVNRKVRKPVEGYQRDGNDYRIIKLTHAEASKLISYSKKEQRHKPH